VKLLHVITTLDVGGAEMHLLAQVRGQTARGHDVRVAYLKGHGTLERDFLGAGAKAVVRVGSGPGLLGRLWPHLRWAEIVHSHLLKADMATAVAATLAGRRSTLLSSKHNDEQVLERPLVSFVHGILGALPRRTICLSDHVVRFIEEHGRIRRDKLVRIYYGLDPAPFELASRDRAARAEARREFGIADDEVVFICVARFAPQKAHDVLLRATAKLVESAPRSRLLLVGDDPFGDGRTRAEQLAAELKLGERVIFAGIRRDVARLLAASDCFVMCSLWEGLGLVFLEAMAAGLPVVATRVSATPEVVEADATGLLVPPRDWSALAAAMERIARDAGLRTALGERGRARVGKFFGLERMVDETLDVYRSVQRAAHSGR
jgi:glycosyltransferase involved in cell wall biosynthesis